MLRLFCLLATIILAWNPVQAKDAPARKNLLLITVDDLNDWITLLEKNAPIATPNLERLAARGVTFSRAYCLSPSCNPSRVGTFLGKRPGTTGVYDNATDWLGGLKEPPITVFSHFRAHGYRVEGTGKIFHHHATGFHHAESFDDFRMLAFPPDSPMPKEKLNRHPQYGSHNTDWGVYPPDPMQHVDIKTVNDAISRLGRLQEGTQPFVLAVGIFRPHMPFFAPHSAFDRYPLEKTTMPLRPEHDLDDIPPGRFKLGHLSLWQGMLKAEQQRPGSYREAVQAYQACATFADQQIGRLLQALEDQKLAESTTIVLWSDHGYHLGEKEHWEKFNLWEKANHIPFIIAEPESKNAGAVCGQPVDMTVMFPTLCELFELPSPAGLDGFSVVTFLQNPEHRNGQPAIMTYCRNNHAVRSERYRYIRYTNGDEEFYDHQSDPNEWTNLAEDSRYSKEISIHRKLLPTQNAKAITKKLKRQ